MSRPEHPLNTIERLSLETLSAEAFAAGYLDYVSTLIKKLDTRAIAAFIHQLEAARQNNNTVFLAGNGGSAATASHMANDIGLDVLKKSKIGTPFRVLALTDNVAVMTAVGNDDGYDKLFVYQLRIHYQPGDKLVVISASGNSPNVVEAARWVKQQGGAVIGLVGFDGGKVREFCDVLLHVETPRGEYGPVEDIHLILNHLTANYLLGKMRQTAGAAQAVADRSA